MPTGYTAPIYEGKEMTFEQFMLRCARNFGALVSMREEPLDAPIPDEFHPDDYHKNQIEKWQEKAALFVRPKREDLESEYQAAYDKAKAEYDEEEVKRKALRNRYEDLIEKVNNWQPPTADHENLKKFALSQLEDSMNHDCHYWEFTFLDKESWVESQMNDDDYIAKELAYHKEQYEKEVKACKARTEWVRQLKASLGV